MFRIFAIVLLLYCKVNCLPDIIRIGKFDEKINNRISLKCVFCLFALRWNPFDDCILCANSWLLKFHWVNQTIVFVKNKFLHHFCLFFVFFSPTKLGGLFHPGDDDQELAFRYAVDKINFDKTILPRSKLSAQIERISPHDSFHASKRGKMIFNANFLSKNKVWCCYGSFHSVRTKQLNYDSWKTFEVRLAHEFITKIRNLLDQKKIWRSRKLIEFNLWLWLWFVNVFQYAICCAPALAQYSDHKARTQQAMYKVFAIRWKYPIWRRDGTSDCAAKIASSTCIRIPAFCQR